jgi:hypothetical protein
MYFGLFYLFYLKEKDYAKYQKFSDLFPAYWHYTDGGAGC